MKIKMVRVRLVHHKKIQISGDKKEKLSDLRNNDQYIQFYQTLPLRIMYMRFLTTTDFLYFVFTQPK